jgi:hypothetical protein
VRRLWRLWVGLMSRYLDMQWESKDEDNTAASELSVETIKHEGGRDDHVVHQS